MSAVKRYRHAPTQYARMFIDTLPAGEYVLATDYDALAAELAGMQLQRDRIAENLQFEREQHAAKIAALQSRLSDAEAELQDERDNARCAAEIATLSGGAQ